MTYFWAYVAGLLTLINPCVLPLLPIIIASALQTTRWGPLALAAGLVLSFVAIGVGVTAFGHALGIDEQLINRTAAVMMIVFGLVLLIPQAQQLLATRLSPLASSANASVDRVQQSSAGTGHGHGRGIAGHFFIGLLLGAVWSPCIGPTLGGAIGLAASGEGLGEATLTMLSFGFGVATLLLALAYGSREVLDARRRRLLGWMPWAKPLMGAVLLLVGLAIFFHIDRVIDSWLLDVMPTWLQDLSVSV